jgi:hypothetical protein
MKIKDVLQAKASECGDHHRAGRDRTRSPAPPRRAQRRPLIVSSDGTSVEGIVSERDIVRRLHEDEGVLGAP